MRPTPRALLIALALAAASIPTPAARAANPPGPPGEAARKNAARHLADKAAAAYEAGRYDEAIATFQKADEAYHAPTLGVALARAYTRAGRLLEARAALQKVIAEKLPPAAPDAFRGAQTTALAELAELATIRVRVTSGIGQKIVITLDGQAPPPPNPDGSVDRDPGPHVVEVSADGRVQRRTLALARGEHGHVDLDVTVPDRSFAPAALAWTVGGAAILVGAITGADAMVRGAAIKARCPGGHCPASEEQEVASARSVAGLATGAFVLAGAAVAAGTTLYLIRPRREAPTTVGVTLGPGSMKLSGRF